MISSQAARANIAEAALQVGAEPTGRLGFGSRGQGSFYPPLDRLQVPSHGLGLWVEMEWVREPAVLWVWRANAC